MPSRSTVLSTGYAILTVLSLPPVTLPPLCIDAVVISDPHPMSSRAGRLCRRTLAPAARYTCPLKVTFPYTLSATCPGKESPPVALGADTASPTQVRTWGIKYGILRSFEKPVCVGSWVWYKLTPFHRCIRDVPVRIAVILPLGVGPVSCCPECCYFLCCHRTDYAHCTPANPVRKRSMIASSSDIHGFISSANCCALTSSSLMIAAME